MASGCLRRTMSNPCMANFAAAVSGGPERPEFAADYPRCTSRFGLEMVDLDDSVPALVRGPTANMSISARCLLVAFDAMFFTPIWLRHIRRRGRTVQRGNALAGPSMLWSLKWTPSDPAACSGWPP